MSPDVVQERQQAYAYLDRLPPAQLSAVRSLLETMLPDPLSRALANSPVEDEGIGEEENKAVARSKEWFKNNQGAYSEEVAAGLGLHHESAPQRPGTGLKRVVPSPKRQPIRS
jgi:hypothetical protein